MRNLFSQILNMSLTGSAVILFVMLARLLLKRFPKIYSYALWSVVLFRLLCPVAFSAPVSVLDVFQPQVMEASESTSMVFYLPADYAQPSEMTFVPAARPAAPQSSTVHEDRGSISPMAVVSFAWMAGIAVMLLCSTVQYLRLRAMLLGAIPYHGNVYLADYIDTPFVMGFLRPRIYLPSTVPTKERKFIIAHERHHIRRFDHVIKLLAYVALCIHWFNPLVWAAFILAGKDMEMSCDEAVIKKLGSQIRADYSASLLRLATHRKIIAGMPLAFGEGDTKGRVMNMAKWKKPKLWVSILCLLLCAAVLAACAVNPAANKDPQTTQIHYYELQMELPDGYTTAEEADSLLLMQDQQQVGKITKYPLPDTPLDVSPHRVHEIAQVLGVPDALQESLTHTGGASLYGHMEVTYLSEEVRNWHCFYLSDDAFYDVCFDKTVISDDQIILIIRTAALDRSSYMESTAPSLMAEIEGSPFQMGQLPEGYAYTFDESQSGESQLISFTNGTEIVGGVMCYPIPEGVYDPDDDVFLWLEEVGIPDFEDPKLCYLGGITSANGGWAVEFASDVPEGVEPDVYRRHHFYVLGSKVYDVWFDLLRIDYVTSDEIRSVVKFSPPISLEQDRTVITAKPVLGQEIFTDLVTYGSLNLVLPPEYGCKENGGSVVITKDGIDVGGITCWPSPDFPYDSDMLQWIRALGLPEAQIADDPIAHTVFSSNYGDLEAEFFYELEPEKLNVAHHFFIDGDLVYDVYYDKNHLSDIQAEQFLKTAQLNTAALLGASSAEAAAFEKVRAVFDGVQSSSHMICQEQQNDGTQGPAGSVTTYCYDNGNQLSISEMVLEGTNITDAGEYYNRQAFLSANGTHYSNEGHWGDRGEIHWSESSNSTIWAPKLSSFRWDKDYVTYMDTLTDAEGECIMYRIDKKFVDHESYTDFYFASFYFDPDGNFVKLRMQVNLFQDNAFTVTESIASLDSTVVAAAIDAEYQRAIQ